MDSVPQPAPIPPPRDRDILTAVLRLVGALAERLTGQVPVVKIENERGDFVWCRVGTQHVRWEEADLVSALLQVSERLERQFPMHVDPEKTIEAASKTYAMRGFEKPTVDQLGHRFDYHAPKGDQAERYCAVRHAIKQAAVACVGLTPCSPEQTRALNALEEAMFLFNSSIARHE